MIFGLLLAVAGIGAACALIYKAAVYAVPFATGVWAGFAALHAGSGPLLAIAIGFVTGAIVFGVGRSICASNLPRALRYVVVLVFVVPAVWTGYSEIRQIAELFGPANPWTTCLSIFGAVAVGITAFARLAGVLASDELHFAIEPRPQRPLR
jgi:hypothetical protein